MFFVRDWLRLGSILNPLGRKELNRDREVMEKGLLGSEGQELCLLWWGEGSET
jgi:hypothetical protein